MGCDFRRIFLKKDFDAGKIKVNSDSLRCMYEVDFDFCCLLFIDNRFEFLLPDCCSCNLNQMSFQINEHNLSKKVKFVSDEEYLLTFEKNFENKLKMIDNVFEFFEHMDDEEFELGKEYFTLPKSTEMLVQRFFPLQYEYVYHKCCSNDQTKAECCQREIESIVESITGICKNVLKHYRFDSNEFCCINMRSGCSDAELTINADKNTFFWICNNLLK